MMHVHGSTLMWTVEYWMTISDKLMMAGLLLGVLTLVLSWLVWPPMQAKRWQNKLTAALGVIAIVCMIAAALFAPVGVTCGFVR